MKKNLCLKKDECIALPLTGREDSITKIFSVTKSNVTVYQKNNKTQFSIFLGY